MHIGFLQTYFSRSVVGGGEVHTEKLARELIGLGHHVTIFTDRPVERRDGIYDLDIREYQTPAKVNPVGELVLAQKAFADMQECDVVVLTDDSAWRGVDLPVPTVMVFHIVWHGWVARHAPIWMVLSQKPQSLVYRFMERKICREADRIVAISTNIREDILLVGDYSEKIVDIPNGVDTNVYRPINESNPEFTIYFQGRLVGMKNPDLLVEAAHISNEDWRVIIGGDGPLREPLAELVAEYGLGDRVELLGYVPEGDLPCRYATADVFVLPSEYEGMPLTILEAAASGTPIVASPRAATEFVTEEIGVVAQPNSTDLAATLDNLSRHPRQVTSMGKRAREKAENYDWAVIADEYQDLFESLVI